MADHEIDPDGLQDVFDDHPSLSASLEDFEHHANFSESGQSPALNIASHHSGFYKSEDGDGDSHIGSDGPFSPPALRFGLGSESGGWSSHRPYQQDPISRRLADSARGSREASPQYESAPEGDTTLPVIPKPRARSTSPHKQSHHGSPNLYSRGLPVSAPIFSSPSNGDSKPVQVPAETPNNFIRFALRAEVQHRTEPFEAAFTYFRAKFDRFTRSRISTILSIMTLLFSFIFLRLLFASPPPSPAPDLIKVAALARSFEPLMYYSENGRNQMTELEQTGIAVWDLGETVRWSNLESGPALVKELEDLSKDINTLNMELHRFFNSVDGDIDGIIMVMEWAKRELFQISSRPLGSSASAVNNFHSVLCRLGVLETANGESTKLGKVISELFGQSRDQRTKKTLHRTFHEFLQVLEDAINNEIAYSTALFSLFDSIDTHLLNLARTVVREADKQGKEEGELLSSLWTRVLGTNAANLRKYQRNKQLLATIRKKTTLNKHIIVDHNGKLLNLKANLETVRKKLLSPLVQSNDSSTISLEEQIRGLDATVEYLAPIRQGQKSKLWARAYASRSGHLPISKDEEPIGIDGSKD
ncbi:MAG: hypothetical protein M1825_005746 [Sarcosagium campestre]|nr:MAG: hypothetical protein M1825_005746 [Sarcosagium campestre]